MRWIAPALVLLVLLLLVATPRALAQDYGWTLVSSVDEDTVSDIVMFDTEFGLAQSGFGVLRTIDGGRHWSAPPSPPLIGAGKIGIADRDHAWITSISGIWRTDDGGLNWHQQNGGPGSASASMTVVSADEAWVTGAPEDFSDIFTVRYPSNALQHTVDGGATWTTVEIPGAGRYFQVQFVGKLGWVTASRCHGGDAAVQVSYASLCPDATMLLHTDDGGSSWSTIASEPEQWVVPRQVRFSDATHGVGIGACPFCRPSLYGTDDGGRTWDVRADGVGFLSNAATEAVWVPYQMCFGGCLRVAYSTDVGRTWSTGISVPGDPGGPPSGQIGASAATDDALLIAGGVTGIRRYDRRSKSWASAITNLRPTLSIARFATRERGYATARGVLWITEDGGGTWAPQTPLPPFEELAVTTTALWISSTAHCTRNCPAFLSRSLDQGRNWQLIGIPSPQKASGFQATDADHAWYYAEEGLWRTQDGGATWALIDADPAASAKGYRFLDAGRGWRGVCSAHSCTPLAFAITLDGGDSWEQRELPPGLTVTQVMTPLVAFGSRAAAPTCRGCGDIAVQTNDGGLTWHDAARADFSIATSTAVFFDDLHGVALGSRRERSVPDTFFETEDGGASWRPHDLPPLKFPIGQLLARDGRVWFLAGLSPSPFPNFDRQVLYRRDVFPSSTDAASAAGVSRAASSPNRKPLVVGLIAAVAFAAVLAGAGLLLRRRRSLT